MGLLILKLIALGWVANLASLAFLLPGHLRGIHGATARRGEILGQLAFAAVPWVHAGFTLFLLAGVAWWRLSGKSPVTGEPWRWR